MSKKNFINIISSLAMVTFAIFVGYKNIEHRIEIAQENKIIIKDADELFNIVKDMPIIDVQEPRFMNNQLFEFNDALRILVLKETFVDHCSEESGENSRWFLTRTKSCADSPVIVNDNRELYQKRITYLYRTKNNNWFTLSNNVITYLGFPREYPFADLNKKFNKAYAYQDLKLISEDEAKKYLFDRDKELYLKFFKIEEY